MKVVDREELLSQLNSVLAGLATHEAIEQSTCFVFDKGQVVTFNDDIACIMNTKLDIKGAVPASLFGSLLRKLPDTELKYSIEKKKLVIKGHHKKARIQIDPKLRLPILEDLDVARKWHKITEEFSDAIGMVEQCADGKRESSGSATLVHITPEYIEATDAFEAARYIIDLKLKQEVCVKRNAIKQMVTLGMTHMGVTSAWVSFKNKATGLIFCCRRYDESDYPSLNEIIKPEKKVRKTHLPKDLQKAADRAGDFAAERLDDAETKVLVTLEPKKIIIKGRGDKGTYTETFKSEYKGEKIKFSINPGHLMEIARRFEECRIGKTILMVTSKKYTYLTSLLTA
jgi:DNA polymerase III sliding clamp (beta) subunit (PCNA family)